MSEDKRKAIKLIALDLDNTTLDETASLTDRTRQAIQRALETGIEVVVATGRSKNSLPQELYTIPNLRYAILSNGAQVYDLKENVALLRKRLPRVAVDRLLEFCRGKFDFQVFIDGQAYASEEYLANTHRYFPENTGRIAHLLRTRRVVSDIVAVALEHCDELDSFDLMVPLDNDRYDIIKQLHDVVPQVYVTTSMRHLIEFTHMDCGKKSGLEWLSEYLHIAPEAMAAFGDDENDVEMLSYVGWGCAVDNGCPAVKKAADHIVASNAEAGVAQEIENILCSQITKQK